MRALWLACVGAAVLLAALLCLRASRRPRFESVETAVIAAGPRTVVLVTGELRFETATHFRAFQHRLRRCLVLVCTWRRCERLASALVDGDASRVCLVADAPPEGIPRPGAYQFYLLQTAVREFRPRLLAARVVARMRTDALYGPGFSLNLPVAPGYVRMETDHAFLAEASTFVRVYHDVWDDMIAARYFRHREEGRAMLPNFANVARSDARCPQRRGWVTRWGWLEFPRAWLARASGDQTRLPLECERDLAELMELRASGSSVPVAQLSPVAPVTEFDAESSFLHYTLERAAVGTLPEVELQPREKRCPFRAACYAG